VSPALSLGAVALALGGVGLLHRAWRDGSGAAQVGLGWLLLIGAVPAWRLGGPSWDMAVALATMAPMLLAAVFLAPQVRHAMRRASAKRRKPKRARSASASDDKRAESTPVWRSLVRGFLVGPMAGAAALGAAAAVALHAPVAQADQYVAALFVLPIVWAAGAIWSTTDGRLARVGAALGAIAVAGFAAAIA
jgi:hypothetical protein